MADREVKIFPQDSETALLSILIKSPDLIYNVTNLRSYMFSSTPYIALFSTMNDLVEQKLVPEYHLVLNYLRSKNKLDTVGGEQTLQYLNSQNFNSNNIKEFERQIEKAYKSRELVQLLSSSTKGVVDVDNVDDIMISLKNSIDKLSDVSGGDITESLTSILESSYKVIVDRIDHPGEVGTSFGIRDVDKTFGGIAAGELWVIAARPSMGKSAMVCNSALGTAKQGNPVLLFSLEMRKQAIVERLLSIETGVPITDIRLGTMSQLQVNKLGDKTKELRDLPIYIDCNFNMNLNYILSTIRKYKKHHDVKVVYIDYIQLLSERDEDQTAELGRISRNLKLLAGELGIGIIMLSQLNRLVEMRDDKRPILSDLRQSGNLEEDADLAVFLYRDDLYHKDSKEKNTMEFIIRKNRNGPIGTLNLKFVPDTNKISGQ